MVTKKLFEENVYLSGCESFIQYVDLENNCIVLNQTVFATNRGGQLSDRGKFYFFNPDFDFLATGLKAQLGAAILSEKPFLINSDDDAGKKIEYYCRINTIPSITIESVREENGHLFHYCKENLKDIFLKLERRNYFLNDDTSQNNMEKAGSEISLGKTFEELKKKFKVIAVLDWDIRLKNMQSHAGEHILSGIFYKEYGLTNTGFRIGESYCTMDLDTPYLENRVIDKVEIMANQYVWKNEPIETKWFKSKDDISFVTLRKPINFEEDIKVVHIKNIDQIGCCGTHPKRTGEIGVIKILKTEKNKGMTRVYFICGKEALEDYEKKQHVINVLSELYSGNIGNIIEKIKGKDHKKDDLLKKLTFFKDTFYEHKALEIKHRFVLQDIESESLNVTIKIDVLDEHNEKDAALDHNDLKKIGAYISNWVCFPFALGLKSKGLWVLISPKCSRKKINCKSIIGNFIKQEINKNIQGGGGEDYGQIILPSIEVFQNFKLFLEEQ